MTSRGSAGQPHSRLREQPRGFSNARGEKQKHRPSFTPSVFNSQRHRFHLIRQRNQESTLNGEKPEPLPPAAFFWRTRARRPSGSGRRSRFRALKTPGALGRLEVSNTSDPACRPAGTRTWTFSLRNHLVSLMISWEGINVQTLVKGASRDEPAAPPLSVVPVCRLPGHRARGERADGQPG